MPQPGQAAADHGLRAGHPGAALGSGAMRRLGRGLLRRCAGSQRSGDRAARAQLSARRPVPLEGALHGLCRRTCRRTGAGTGALRDRRLGGRRRGGEEPDGRGPRGPAAFQRPQLSVAGVAWRRCAGDGIRCPPRHGGTRRHRRALPAGPAGSAVEKPAIDQPGRLQHHDRRDRRRHAHGRRAVRDRARDRTTPARRRLRGARPVSDGAASRA